MRASACRVLYFIVVAVGWPLSLLASALAYAADWLDDLSYQLLDRWLP